MKTTELSDTNPAVSVPQKKRDASVDLMRFIGISCIILAHIGISWKSTLFQIRTFDVPLMLFVSGLAYAGRSVGSYGSFAWHRAKRLIVPVYVFLVCYFVINFILSQFGLWEQVPKEKIIGSFMFRLNPSIDYVWVIRVFLIVMLMTPALIWLNNKLKSRLSFLLTIAGMLIVQEAMIAWLEPLNPGRFVNDYVFYVLGYSVMFLLGIRIRHADVRDKLMMLALVMLAFAIMAFPVSNQHGSWLVMQSYKYPPHAYYVLWGGIGAITLWCVAPYVSGLMSVPLIKFIGGNTIWIYLWHIPFIKPIRGAIEGGSLWPVRYVLIYGLAVLVFFVQYRIVRAIEKRNEQAKRVTKYFVG